MNTKSTPYPKLGECIDVLATVLDLIKADSDVGRLAREGDFDWEKVDKVIQTLLLEPTERYYGVAATKLVGPWLSEVRGSYCKLILEVSLDSVDRDETFPILIEDFFAPLAAQLLLNVHDQMPGPDLPCLLDAAKKPMAVVFQWLDVQLGESTEKLLYPQTTDSDRVDREKIRKWRNAVDLPSAQSIKLFTEKLRDARDKAALAETTAIWLMIAAALTRFDRRSSEPVRSQILRKILANSRDLTVQHRLLKLVQAAAENCPGLVESGLYLWEDLKRTSSKQVGDQDRTWREIGLLESQAKAVFPDGRADYHCVWMKARWHVLSGRYQEALPHYEQAFELACYRAGSQTKDILEEASTIAAFLEKRVFLKQLKHVGIVYGLFQKPEKNAAVLEDWELEQFANQLFQLFPPQGRFVESPMEFSESLMPGLMFISKESVSKIKMDLKNPDRVRAVKFSDDTVRRWPQLRLFASFGLHEQVNALLDAGASVDKLDSFAASALLCALQHAESSGERDSLDMLLKKKHQPATLDASTHRKRWTPLLCAIDFGEPDVVQTLLEQGANADKRGFTDQQSPLYYVVSKLFRRIHPRRMYTQYAEHLLRDPDLVQKDALRRYGSLVGGTFGDGARSLLKANPEVALFLAKIQLEQEAARYSVSKLTEITGLLLKFGAKPNAGHNYPVPGRTPLMLAAESDLPEVFDLMIQYGGDPLQPDADGQNCKQIAASFRSEKVLSYIQRGIR